VIERDEQRALPERTFEGEYVMARPDGLAPAVLEAGVLLPQRNQLPEQLQGECRSSRCCATLRAPK
jgi:hypothetical protein